MRLVLGFILFACLGTACDGKDIGDNDPINNAGDIDASDIDADPNAPDASDIDSGALPDAETRAGAFCSRYETLCGFDNANADRFDDQNACINAFDGFDAGQQTCVENQLDAFETDGMQNHCTRATGTGPCS